MAKGVVEPSFQKLMLGSLGSFELELELNKSRDELSFGKLNLSSLRKF